MQRVVGECVGEGGGTIVYDEIVQGYCLDPCTDEYDDGYIDAYYVESWSESHGGAARAIPNLERENEVLASAIAADDFQVQLDLLAFAADVDQDVCHNTFRV